jgi:hypothetical protein
MINEAYVYLHHYNKAALYLRAARGACGARGALLQPAVKLLRCCGPRLP